jgi:endonuclease/exonuclease/phosphatase family metal-dependent hydrolase
MSDVDEQTLRVMSWNIHKGFTVGNQNFVLEHIRHALRSTGVNIVCLQEVVGENQRHAKSRKGWISETQFEFLADQVWHHHAYGRNAVYPHGHHGNAILSDWPLTLSCNHDISVLPLSQRGVLHAVTEGLHIFCAHFGLLAWERRRQLVQLEHLLETVPPKAPILLCGDFNDWHARTHARLLKSGLHEVLEECNGKLQATFPALFPVLPMDRIYYRGLQLQSATRLDVGTWRVLSDHCPVMATFATP